MTSSSSGLHAAGECRPRAGSGRPAFTGALTLPLALGVCDGILNALTLSSNAVLHGDGLTLTLAVRVGMVALVSSVFAVYVSDYAQRRGRLGRAERELNLMSAGRLASSHLGRQTVRDSVVAATTASVASFAGAFIPLMIGAVITRASWTALVVAVTALGAFGSVLASGFGGRRWVWAVAMAVAGVAVAAIGAELKIT